MDELPVGGGSKLDVQEFADAAGAAGAAAAEGVDSRPLQERLSDKSWKARVSAYEQLMSEVKSSLGEDPLFAEYASKLKDITSDR